MFQGAQINLQPRRTMTITIIRTIKKKNQEGRGEKREQDRVEKKIDGIKQREEKKGRRREQRF